MLKAAADSPIPSLVPLSRLLIFIAVYCAVGLIPRANLFKRSRQIGHAQRAVANSRLFEGVWREPPRKPRVRDAPEGRFDLGKCWHQRPINALVNDPHLFFNAAWGAVLPVRPLGVFFAFR